MRIGIVLLLCLLVSTIAIAQPPGSVVVYSDNMQGSCSVVENGFIQLYYFHHADIAASAVEFVCDVSNAVGWTLFGDISPFALKQGTFTNFPISPPPSWYGCAIAYQQCLSGSIYLGSTAFGVTGATPACTKIYVENTPIPSIPGATYPIAVGCPSGFLHLRGSYAVVNPDETCPCPRPFPVESKSWGEIKSLYR